MKQDAQPSFRDGALTAAPTTAGSGRPVGDELVARSGLDDERIALHEIGGVTCDPFGGHSGLCWGPTFQFKFAGDDSPSLCAQIGPLMPGPGEPRTDVADIFLHVHTRVVELVAGSVAEALFLPGEPWPADSDRAQERALASLVCSSPESVEAFIDFCMAEAAALLRPREHIVRALTKELLCRRTMTGMEVDEVIATALAREALAKEKARRAAWAETCAKAAEFRKVCE
jgi:hypothetical protein